MPRIDGPTFTPKTQVISAGGGALPTDVVWVRKIEDAWKAGVSPNYVLLQPVKASETPRELEVTGKLTSGDDEDGGWNATMAGDEVWVEITVDASLEGNSAYVQSKGLGAEWGGGEVEHDGGDPAAQSKARIMLAKIVPSGADLVARCVGGMIHRLGVTLTDAGGPGGGDPKAITAATAGGM